MVHTNLDKSAQNIFNKGFTTIAVDNMEEAFLLASEGFEVLLNTPWLRQLFTIPENQWKRDELGEPYEIGLLDKKRGELKESDTEGFFDKAAGRKYNDVNKERFHYSDDLLNYLPNNYQSGFLTGVKSLNNTARLVVERLFNAFMRDYQFISAIESPETLIDRCEHMMVTTRLIRYGAVSGTALDAQVHRDRCTITVHHWSNHAGLRVFDRQQIPHLTDETDPASVTVFTGEKFWGMTRGVFGTGVPHGVLDERRIQNVHNETPRFVAVSFVHVPLTLGDCAWMKAHLADIKIDQSLYEMV